MLCSKNRPKEFESAGDEDLDAVKSYIDKDMMPSSSDEDNYDSDEENDAEINNNIVNNPNKINN